ncbi:MAG: hypothetical protein ACQES4_07945, partial [Bacillota bacterium]
GGEMRYNFRRTMVDGQRVWTEGLATMSASTKQVCKLEARGHKKHVDDYSEGNLVADTEV